MPRICKVDFLSNTLISEGTNWQRSKIKQYGDACVVYSTKTSELKRLPNRNSMTGNTITVHITGEVAEKIDYIRWKNGDENTANEENLTYYGRVWHYAETSRNTYTFWISIDWWLTYAPTLGEITTWLVRKPAVKVTDTEKVTKNFLREPVEVPRIQCRYNIADSSLSQTVAKLLNFQNMKFGVYLSSNSEGVYENDGHLVKMLCGVPFVGFMYVFDTLEEVFGLVQKYVNRSSNYMSQNSAPLLSNVLKIVYAPSQCFADAVAYTEEVKIALTPQYSAFTYCKELSPQFVNAEIVSCASGERTSFNLLSCDVDHKTGELSLYGGLYLVGGLTPSLQIAFNVNGDQNAPQVESKSRIIESIVFPEIPVALFMQEKPNEIKWKGVLADIAGKTLAGVAGGATIGLVADGVGAVPGAILGGFAGAVEGGAKAVLKHAEAATAVTNNDYIKTPNSNGVAYALNAYRFELFITYPTTQGVQILRDWFKRFGETTAEFNVMPEEGFVQINGAVWESDTKLPAEALDGIKNMLEKGVYLR